MQPREKRRFEKGNVTLITALSTLVIGAFAALAIDFGYMHYKKSQLQAAADAGALAGAAALVSQGTQAAASGVALTFGRANIAATDHPELAIRNADVTFPASGQVEVAAGMTAARGNPVAMSIGKMLGLRTGDVTATARAGSFCVTGTKCLKPWSPPAKFTWNDACDSNNKYKNNGAFDPDSVCEKNSVQVQGYGPGDVGTQIVLKQGDPATAIVPSQFGPIDFPPANTGNPVTGGNAYSNNISGCTDSNNTMVNVGDSIQLEPGNKTGPTSQGTRDLVNQDPGAYWDSGSQSVKGSAYSDPSASPRVATMAFYDPRNPPTSGRNTITVYQLASVFIEGVDGNGNVTCRFMNNLVPSGSVGSTQGNCGLLYSIRLVRDSSR